MARRQRKKILAETLPAPDSNTNEEHLNIGRTNVRFFAGIKAAKTFSIVVAVLMFCIVTPNVVGKALIYSGSNPVIRKIWFRIFHYEFYGINSVVNVFIYGTRHLKYRKAIAKICFKFIPCYKVSK